MQARQIQFPFKQNESFESSIWSYNFCYKDGKHKVINESGFCVFCCLCTLKQLCIDCFPRVRICIHFHVQGYQQNFKIDYSCILHQTLEKYESRQQNVWFWQALPPGHIKIGFSQTLAIPATHLYNTFYMPSRTLYYHFDSHQDQVYV